MRLAIHQTRPAVIEFPRELDTNNAGELASLLRAEHKAGRIIVADMALTTFCDSRGTQELLKVHRWAITSRCELRIARPSADVLRVWLYLGADQIFNIYPTLDGALKPRRRPAA